MKKIILMLVLISSFHFSQNEFKVNTYSDSTQRWPAIDRDGSGNYYVVWQSLNQISPSSQSDIYLQMFDQNDVKIGTEVLVNFYTSENQEKPFIATNASGKSIIVWSSFIEAVSSYDIRARIFNQNTAVGNEIFVNTFTPNTQTNPVAAIKSNGEFIIVWDSWFQDGSDRGVYAQRFDANGNKIGSEFRVNHTIIYSQAKPKVKYFSDEKFIVIWESFKQDGSGYGLYGRIFNSDGTPNTNEFQINTFISDYQWYGDLDVFADDSFIVVWCSWEQDGDDGGIYVQRFNGAGQKIGNETRINKTTAQYQWLPKIKKLTGKNAAVVWSSWKQDGSREGVVTAFIDENNQLYTFETIVNSYTESFQWEPDFIVTAADEILVVWSSWEQFGSDYDIVAKRIKPQSAQGVINPSLNLHPTGSTTSKFIVHVVDSIALSGDTYKIYFQVPGSTDTVFANILNESSSQLKVQNFPIDKGLNTFYLTQAFDGVAVEFLPQFKLELDLNVYFINNSGSNLIFSYVLPSSGQKLLAPIDVALIWGSTDTLANGQYVAPLDTALSITGQKNVIVPFKAVNLMNGLKLTTLVKELAATKNNKWDPKEEIVFITPPPYQVNPFNTHAQINSNVPTGTVILPNSGDTNYVLTKRPITPADTFYFTTNRSYIVADLTNENFLPERFELFQNFPNPFNPSTKIVFRIPNHFSNSTSIKYFRVQLKVYDILGREIANIIDDEFKPGFHTVIFNSDQYSLSSGVYFYTLRAADFRETKKMILLR